MTSAAASTADFCRASAKRRRSVTRRRDRRRSTNHFEVDFSSRRASPEVLPPRTAHPLVSRGSLVILRQTKTEHTNRSYRSATDSSPTLGVLGVLGQSRFLELHRLCDLCVYRYIILILFLIIIIMAREHKSVDTKYTVLKLRKGKSQ